MHFLAVTAWLCASTTGTLYTLSSVYETDNIQLRFRHIPSYGNGVIRKFADNTSEMKKLAARDFENILQVRLVATCVDVQY